MWERTLAGSGDPAPVFSIGDAERAEGVLGDLLCARCATPAARAAGASGGAAAATAGAGMATTRRATDSASSSAGSRGDETGSRRAFDVCAAVGAVVPTRVAAERAIICCVARNPRRS